jgi:hypothetical protein
MYVNGRYALGEPLPGVRHHELPRNPPSDAVRREREEEWR